MQFMRCLGKCANFRFYCVWFCIVELLFIKMHFFGMCVAHILLFRTAEMIQMIHFQLSIYVGFYSFFLKCILISFHCCNCTLQNEDKECPSIIKIFIYIIKNLNKKWNIYVPVSYLKKIRDFKLKGF